MNYPCAKSGAASSTLCFVLILGILVLIKWYNILSKYMAGGLDCVIMNVKNQMKIIKASDHISQLTMKYIQEADNPTHAPIQNQTWVT